MITFVVDGSAVYKFFSILKAIVYKNYCIMVTKMRFKNIDIIGTSHISRESVKEIREAVSAYPPDMIAVELDEDRAYALLYQKEGNVTWAHRKTLGWNGYYFAKIGHWAEAKLGDIAGMKPGAEMKEAILLAKKHNIPVVFIDQHITKTLRRFSSEFTWREKFRMVWDVFEGMGRYIIRKPEFEFDLRTVPEKELMKKMLGRVKKHYPNMYKVLVTERNEFMAKKLFLLQREHPNKRILAVMGAGHVDDVIDILKKKDRSTDVIHYKSSYQVSL
jgi:pheromone shutdown-related protein TraB